jgi:electron transfer flavoprotein beta subunit
MTVANIAVALKWVSLRPEIDPLSGSVVDDSRWFGLSLADEAALEWALRLGENRSVPVTAVSVGTSDGPLQEALDRGATRAVRIDEHDGAPSSSVAASLAANAPADALWVCGDYSADRGSGSVPAFLAHCLAVPQALGLVGVDISTAGSITAMRRLDGGRREQLRVAGPAVLSVEGSSASLRRAPLSAALRPRHVDVVAGGLDGAHATGRLRPYRPRARDLPPPHGDQPLDRIRTLTGALVERTPPKQLHLEADAAASAILQQLRAWGYLT